tara:strand:+ start:116 stop:1510 length:1395 start_codon:yes stop_codon:yes gene_type:complete
MVYPRLRLARNILSDDGVILASIDENEVVNMRKVFDEVFGEGNLLFQITLLCNPKGRSQDKYIANCHEYLVGYSKRKLNKGDLNIPKSDEEISKNYKMKDKRGQYRELELRNTHREFGRHNRQNLYYPFYVNSKGVVSLDEAPGSIPVYPVWDDGFEGCWTWGTGKAKGQIDEIVAKEVKGSWKIYRKNYAEDDNGEATKQVKSIWVEKQFHTEKGQAAFNELFQTKRKIFQSPKSVETIKQLLLMGSKQDSIILDFFAGSATTAQAAMQLNTEDGGNRRFIMVQIPEACDEKSEAFKAGYSTIAEISKERIRRAGKKIKEESPETEGLDTGFRVLKIDSSNMNEVYYRPDAVAKGDLFNQVEHIKTDRSSEDLLFQVMLDWGVDLSLPMRKETIECKEVYFVNDDDLVACFDKGIDEALIKALAAKQPLRVVFRDDGFVSDSVKINVEQIFKQLAPATDIKAI